MEKTKCFLLIAVIFYSGFFSCNTTTTTGPTADSVKASAEKEKAVKLAQPFNCATDEQVPLGYLDTTWVYRNPGLGIRFEFPKGWNAMDDILKSSPTFVRVGGNYYEFRESYLKPRSSGLQVMKNDGWSDPRFMFGITHVTQPVYSDTINPNFSDSVFTAAYLFYTDHSSEKALYADLIVRTLKEWEREEYSDMNQLNHGSIKDIKIEQIGRDTFFTQVIKIPKRKGVLHYATSIKKKGCLYVLLIFSYYNEEERQRLLDGMRGLSLSNT